MHELKGNLLSLKDYHYFCCRKMLVLIKLKRKKHVLSLINYIHCNSMKLKLIRLIIVSVLCLISARSAAQDEYKAEIGFNIGGSYYLGDANHVLFNNMQPALSGFFRYCFNPRLATKIEITSTTVTGDGFSNGVIASDLTGEFNFFDLEKNPYKQFSKTFSPYIFAGFGMMNYSAENIVTGPRLSKFTPSIPFGLGMKVKLGKRWNLNMQWTTRLSLSDNLEGTELLSNPKQLNGSNPFNNDILSTLTVGLSFDIWKKNCDCLNSSVKKDSHKFKKK